MKKQFEDLVQKTLHDEAFRNALRTDPKKALSTIGVEATPEMLTAVQAIDWEPMERLALAFANSNTSNTVC